MTSLRLLLIAALGLALVPVPARADSVRDALDAARDALDAARESSKSCRRAVVDDLDEAVNGLKRLKDGFDRKRARDAERDLEDARDAARDQCPHKVVGRIRDALDSLESILDRDDDDRGHHGVQPVDHPGDRPVVRPRYNCWNSSDPGCRHTKDGNPPMDQAAFDGFLKALRASKPNVFNMKDVVEASLQNATLTSQQLGVIVEEFKPNSLIMLDVVKLGAPRLVDPQNGGGVSAKLAPNTILVQEAAEVIGQQRGD